MADKDTPVPSKNAIMRILKGAAGLKDLTPKQQMLKLADMGKTNVKNLIRLGGIKGAALTLAVDVAMRMLPEPTSAKKGGADPLGLMKPKRKTKTPVKPSASETRRQQNQTSTPKAKKKLVAMKDQGKGGTPGDGSTAVKKSLRPKARPFKDGGMPMVMKDGKKVPAYAADGVGKMNKGGMAKKKPAAKKMMGGGMAKTGYMYGGMAKKTKAKK